MYAEAEKVKDTFAKEKADKNSCQLKRQLIHLMNLSFYLLLSVKMKVLHLYKEN